MFHRETLIYSVSGMKRKEPGAQKARHIIKIGELSSTARRSDSPAQPINQRFHRRLLVALMLTLFSTTATARWVRVDENAGYTKYADMSKTRKEDNLVRIWTLTDFKTLQKNDRGKTYLSLDAVAEHDCKNLLHRIIGTRGFSGNMGTGNIAFTETSPNGNWKEIAPETYIEAEWKTACGTKIEWMELGNSNETAPLPGVGKISKEFTLYIGKDKIRRQGSIVKVWTLIDFNATRTYGGKDYLSRKSLQEFDCDNMRSRGIGTFWLSGNMGKLNPVASDNTYEEWSTVKPGSIGGLEWKVACGTK